MTMLDLARRGLQRGMKGRPLVVVLVLAFLFAACDSKPKKASEAPSVDYVKQANLALIDLCIRKNIGSPGPKDLLGKWPTHGELTLNLYAWLDKQDKYKVLLLSGGVEVFAMLGGQFDWVGLKEIADRAHVSEKALAAAVYDFLFMKNCSSGAGGQ